MGLFEALFVGSVLLAMLSLLFVGWKSPEIVVRGCKIPANHYSSTWNTALLEHFEHAAQAAGVVIVACLGLFGALEACSDRAKETMVDHAPTQATETREQHLRPHRRVVDSHT